MAKLGTLTLDLIAKTGGFTEPMKKAGDTAQREAKKIESSSNVASKAVLGLGASIAGAFSVGMIIEQADAYTQMAARIRNATTDATEYDMVQKRLLNTANGTYRALSEAQEVYLATSSGLKELGYNTKQALDISDSLSYSFVHNATSADKAQAAMNAYGKVLDKNKIEADAWSSIIAAVPNILNDVSKATGKSTQEVRKLGATGKLAAEDLHKGFLMSLDANKALADNMENSLADGIMKVKNNFQVMVGEANMTLGATSKLADGLGVLADNMQTVASVGGILAGYIAGSYIPAIAKATVAGYQKSRQLLEQTTIQYAAIQTEKAAAASNLALAESQLLNTQQTLTAISTEKALEVERLKAQINSIGRQKALTRMAELKKVEALATRDLATAESQLAAARARSAVAATASTGVGRAALGMLGGPVGLGLTVASVAAGYLLLSKNTQDHTVSLRENNESVQDAIVKYRELNEVQQAGQMVKEREKLKELETQYRSTESAMAFYAVGMTSTKEIITQSDIELEKLFKQYQKTKDLKAFTLAVQQSAQISQQAKDRIAEMATKVNDSGKAARDQKQYIDQIKGSIKGIAQEAKQSAAELSGMTEALNKLTGETQKETYKNKLVAGLMQQYNLEQRHAEKIYEARQAAGILGTTKPLSNSTLQDIAALMKSEQQISDIVSKRNDAEKTAEKVQKEQLKAAEKKYQYTDKELKMLEKVAGINAKYSLNKVGAKYGLPDNLLAAVMAQESKGNINAKSPTGAIGPFQTTGIYRKQYGLSVADSYDVQKAAEVAAKDLANSFKIFGNWNDAITAYNAGVAGTKSLKATGFTQSAAKTKEAKNYAPSINKWFSALDGGSDLTFENPEDAIKIYQDYLEDIEAMRAQMLERQKSVSAVYFTDEERIHAEHKEKIKAIEEAFAGDDAAIKKYSDLQNAEYQNSLREHQQFLKSKSLDERKQLLEVRKNWMSAEEYASQYYALVREEILTTAEYSPEMKEVLIRQTNSQQGIAQEAERESVWGDYQWRFGNQDPYQDDMNLLQNALDQKLIMEDEYYRQRAILQTTFASDYLSSTADVLKNVLGEESGYYQAAFAMAKGMAVAKVALNAPETYSNVYNAVAGIPFVGPYIAPVMAAGAVAVQLAQAATLGNVQLTGMAHDGIDSIPKEGTWLLDGGERVLNPQQNKDLTNYLANKPSKSQAIDNKLSVIMVKDDDEAKNYRTSKDFENAVIHHVKRNKKALA